MLLFIPRRKFCFIALIVISSLGLFALLPDDESESPLWQPGDTIKSSSRKTVGTNVVDFESSLSNKRFNISGDDLLVLIHIQKTGGTTFERHLVQDIILNTPCSCAQDKRRCHCPRGSRARKEPKTLSNLTWLVSRFSTGWICGLHPSFSQLERCLAEAKRIYFLTLLRHPLHRFVSEFRHVQRGATWKASRSHCGHYDTQLCYGARPDWSNATLDEFLSCPNNMAINRQTRMLASYDTSSRCDDSMLSRESLLRSAKMNLDKIAYFGICEKQRSSQLLFEKTFDLKFKTNFKQSEDNKTRIFIDGLPGAVVQRILETNSLDMSLYNYAVDLFAKRLSRLTNSSCCAFMD